MVEAAVSGAERIAILPLRNSVLFPMSVVPINVGRSRSVRLVEDLGGDSALVGVVAQKNASTVEPTFDDLFDVGTLARVVKIIRLGPDNYSVVLNGLARFRIQKSLGLEPYMQAIIERIAEPSSSPEIDVIASALRARTRTMLEQTPDLPKETVGILDNVPEPGALADLIASNFPDERASVAKRQQILQAFDLERRVQLVHDLVDHQLQVLTAKEQISEMVNQEMSLSQREYVLRQQLKSIREELGESGDDDEVELLRERVAKADMPPEAEKAAKKQLNRLRGMQPQSAEYNVAHNYVEWLSDLPWSRSTPEHIDVREVRRCLDEDHHGLEKVKKRITEYTAIRQLRTDKRGPILLFVGPPGTGKTSLGRSIARATGRKYARVSLGGVRDEAEIRGHRRTYVGALPGRIIQALKKVGTKNPVLVLDEVDKLGSDARGDPAAALLEVLDPEQNDTFVDHFLDVAFDLSQVLFLATANYRAQIPEALADRLEIIEVPGYPRTDKIAIAEQFLVPKQLSEHGLDESRLSFTREGIELIVDSYTREAGVRGLERQIASVCRDEAVSIAEGDDSGGTIATREHVEHCLGVPRYQPELAERKAAPGVATGLAVTPAGGELLFVEVTRMRGSGKVHITGSLGSIMKESAETALAFVRSKAERLLLDPEWLSKIDIHIHVPRARAVYDDTSAGVTIFVAVVSLLLNTSTRDDVAVMGELTLRGNILPVRDVEATVLAAHRAGIREIVMPARNERDLEEISDEITSELEFHFVKRLDEVLALVLEQPTRSEQSSPVATTTTPA